MFGLFKKKSKKDKLIELYNKKKEQAFKISRTNRKESGQWDESTKYAEWDSDSAEIAVFDKDGEFINISGYELEKEDGTIEKVNDVVLGWLSTDTVAKCITIVQSATTKEEIETKIRALNL